MKTAHPNQRLLNLISMLSSVIIARIPYHSWGTFKLAYFFFPSNKFRVKRLELGVFDVAVEGPVNLMHIPHTLLGQVNDSFSIFIFFPEFKNTTSQEDKKDIFLNTEDQKMFIDQVLIPALKEVFSDSLDSNLNRLPTSFPQVSSVGIQTYSRFNIPSSRFASLIENMRNQVDTDDNRDNIRRLFNNILSYNCNC